MKIFCFIMLCIQKTPVTKNYLFATLLQNIGVNKQILINKMYMEEFLIITIELTKYYIQYGRSIILDGAPPPWEQQPYLSAYEICVILILALVIFIILSFILSFILLFFAFLCKALSTKKVKKL